MKKIYKLEYTEKICRKNLQAFWEKQGIVYTGKNTQTDLKQLKAYAIYIEYIVLCIQSKFTNLEDRRHN